MDKPRILVLLQNAYDKGSLAQGWSPARWRCEFESSRTGVRLRVAVPMERFEVRYANSGNGIGQGPDAKIPVNCAHVCRALKRVKPAIVLACGEQASRCAQIWHHGPLVCIPHPAFRLLTNTLLETCNRALSDWSVFHIYPNWRQRYTRSLANSPNMRIQLKQRRGPGGVEVLSI